jgi:hypothetical protein
MGDVLTFTPRPKPAKPEALEPLTGPEIRASLEAAAQVALDAADRISAVLDRMDGDTDLGDGADAEPSLAAPKNHTSSQVTWLRGNDQGREAEVSERLPPEVEAEPKPEAQVLPCAATGTSSPPLARPCSTSHGCADAVAVRRPGRRLFAPAHRPQQLVCPLGR